VTATHLLHGKIEFVIDNIVYVEIQHNSGISRISPVKVLGFIMFVPSHSPFNSSLEFGNLMRTTAKAVN
jgi:hypothetical protein